MEEATGQKVAQVRVGNVVQNAIDDPVQPAIKVVATKDPGSDTWTVVRTFPDN